MFAETVVETTVDGLVVVGLLTGRLVPKALASEVGLGDTGVAAVWVVVLLEVELLVASPVAGATGVEVATGATVVAEETGVADDSVAAGVAVA